MKLKKIPIKQHINELIFVQLILHSDLNPELYLYSSMVLKVNDCDEDESAFILGDINVYKSNKEALTKMNRMIVQSKNGLSK